MQLRHHDIQAKSTGLGARETIEYELPQWSSNLENILEHGGLFLGQEKGDGEIAIPASTLGFLRTSNANLLASPAAYPESG